MQIYRSAAVLCVALCWCAAPESLSSEQEQTGGPDPQSLGARGEEEVLGVSRADEESQGGPSEGAEVQGDGDGVEVLSDGESEEVQVEGDGEDGKQAGEEVPRATFIPEIAPNINTQSGFYETSWIIMFYASWCPYSRDAAPVFLDLFQLILTSKLPIHLGKMEVTEDGDVVKSYKIKSTPTFLLFKNGTRYEFEGEISLQNFVSFVSQIMGPDVTEVAQREELEEQMRNHSVVFLLVCDQELDDHWQHTYFEVARKMLLKGTFLYTTSPDLLKESSLVSLPGILVLKDDTSYAYKDALSKHSLTQWVNSERMPAFGAVNDSTILPYLKTPVGKQLAVLVVDDDPSKRRIAQRKAVEATKRLALSRKQHRSYWFVLLESVETAERIVRDSPIQLPLFLVYEPRTRLYYTFQPSQEDKGFTEKSISNFLTAVRNGNIKAEGGLSYLDSLGNFGVRVYTIIQTMAAHRPFLSGVAVLSLLLVLGFYLTICCQRPQHSTHTSRRRRRRVGGRAGLAHSRREDSPGSVRRRRASDQEEKDRGAVMEEREQSRGEEEEEEGGGEEEEEEEGGEGEEEEEEDEEGTSEQSEQLDR